MPRVQRGSANPWVSVAKNRKPAKAGDSVTGNGLSPAFAGFAHLVTVPRAYALGFTLPPAFAG